MIVNETFFPGVTYAHLATELARELAYRRKTYTDRVNGGRMTQAEADYQLAIFTAIGADIDRMQHIGPAPLPPPTHGYGWAERRKALQRELDLRDRYYPQWINSGRITREAATRQRTAMAAILWRYDAGFDWQPQSEARRTEERREIWGYPDGHFWQRYAPQTEPAQAAML